MSISDDQKTYQHEDTDRVAEERPGPWGALRDERPAGYEDEPPVEGSVRESDRDDEVDSPEAYRDGLVEPVGDDETAVGRARVPEQREGSESVSYDGPASRDGSAESPTLYDAEAGTPLSGAAVADGDLERYDERLSRVDRDLDTEAPHPADVAADPDGVERAGWSEHAEEATSAPAAYEPVAVEPVAVPVVGEVSADAATVPVVDAGLKPGEATVEPIDDLWDDAKLSDFRDRWREAQLSFVDDPRQAVEQIRSVVDEAVDLVTGALTRQRDALADWQDGQDTEQLRMVVRRYRMFFDRVLEL